MLTTRRPSESGPLSASPVVKEVSDRINENKIDLPLLPVVAARAMELARDQDADATALAALIQQDQSLAGHVIRIANSPAFSPRAPIVSLQQAIARLGMSMIAEITLTIALKTKLFQHGAYLDDMRYLWQHSIASAAWCREIGRTKRTNAETAFLCGLLHQVGRPVVLNMTADVAKELGEEISHEELMRLVDGWYTEVGGMLATRWKLPEVVTEVIVFHRFYDDAPSFAEEAKMANVAGLFATHLLRPETMPREMLLQAEAVQDCNLYPEDVEQLLSAIEGVEKMVASFPL